MEFIGSTADFTIGLQFSHALERRVVRDLP